MMGGCMMGTSAICKYSCNATIGPIRFCTIGPSGRVRKLIGKLGRKENGGIAVGTADQCNSPDSCSGNSGSSTRNVTKIPTCAAAPSNISFGFEMRDEKSV